MSAYTDPGDWCTPVGGILYRAESPLMWEVGTKGSGMIVTVSSLYHHCAECPDLRREALKRGYLSSLRFELLV